MCPWSITMMVFASRIVESRCAITKLRKMESRSSRDDAEKHKVDTYTRRLSR